MTNDLKVSTLLEDCLSGDPSRQAPAISNLKELDAYDAVPTLLELLDSPESNIRSLAVEALEWLGDNEVGTIGPKLTELLIDEESLIRSDAIEALGILGYGPAIESAKLLLRQDPDWLVRVSAIEALVDLSNVGNIEVLEQFENVLGNPNEDEMVAAYAAWGLGVLGTSEMLPKLKEYLISEESLRVKVEIIAARYRLGSSEDLDLLLSFLKESDEEFVRLVLTIITNFSKEYSPESFLSDIPKICRHVEQASRSLTSEGDYAIQVINELSSLVSET
jgi:HEAT repeat protein